MHALNNSVDHGFLRSGPRVDRDREVRLDIKAYCEGETLCLDILDNGAGLDLQKITKRAQELKLTAPSDDPYRVLFEDGFSTARDLSESSGRGVGLAAIAALSQEWKGSVRIQPGEASQGTRLQIRIPRQRAA